MGKKRLFQIIANPRKTKQLPKANFSGKVDIRSVQKLHSMAMDSLRSRGIKHPTPQEIIREKARLLK